MQIAGIDPSIDSSGKCIMTLDDNYEVIKIKFHGYNKVKKRCIKGENFEVFHVGTNYSKLNLFERQNLGYEVIHKCMHNVKYVAFEGYSYSSSATRAIFQLGEYIGGMKKMFYEQGKGIMIYAPRMVKRFATGDGNAEKVTMCEMFKKEFPHLYPEGFKDLRQYEEPHSDMCDAFWMAETLRNHIIYEHLGAGYLDEGTVAFLEQQSDKKSTSIVETKLIKKSV